MRLGHALGVVGAFTALDCIAQELLPNGYFESYTECPDYLSQIDRCTGWSRPTIGTSDYFNGCAGPPYFLHVPDNQFGEQAPHSGQGYAGFYCFYNSLPFTQVPDDNREYVTHPLAQPLVPGTTYSVQFRVSLADASHYAVSDLGALFTVLPPYRGDNLAIMDTPQITHLEGTFLADKSDWMLISGCFVAQEAYTYITIGNFHDGASTQILALSNVPVSEHYAYYYVDDVSVQALTAPSLGPDRTACSAIDLAVEHPLPGIEYHWSNGATGTQITVDSSGRYVVSTGSGSCAVSDTVLVFIAEAPEIQLPTDTVIDFCAQPNAVIGLASMRKYEEWQWSAGTITSSITIECPGTYTLEVTNSAGCTATTIINVADGCTHPIFLPNAFTPNGDGLNDAWGPVRSGDQEPPFELEVFDRWGSLVFRTDNMNVPWSGRSASGADLVGIFAYRLRLLGKTGEPDRTLRGHVTVVR